MRIGIDLDNCLLDFLPRWIDAINEVVLPSKRWLKVEDIKTWDMRDYLSEDELSRAYRLLTTSWFWNRVKLVEGCQTTLRYLIEKYPNIEFIVITATPLDVSVTKYERLFALLPMLSANNLVVTNRKDLIDVDIMIDDNPKHLKSKLERLNILFNRTHNENQDCDACIRVNNWTEIIHIIDTCCIEVHKAKEETNG